MNKIGKSIFPKTASLALLVGIVAFTSACGGAAGSETLIAPETNQSTAAPATTSPADTKNTAAPTASTPSIGTPAPTGELVKSEKGDYLQSVIGADDPAMKYNPVVVDESLSNMDQADILAAQQAIVSFIAEQGIDSPLNGGLMTRDDWWAKNKKYFHPDYHDNMYQDISEGKLVVLQETWQKEKYGDAYHYVTSPDQPRIYNRTIKPTVLWLVEPNYKTVALEAEVSYDMPVVPNVGLTGTGVQKSSGTMTFSATKDATTGKWLIDGYDHKMNTTEG